MVIISCILTLAILIVIGAIITGNESLGRITGVITNIYKGVIVAALMLIFLVVYPIEKLIMKIFGIKRGE